MRVILHAPTAAALTRARSGVRQILRQQPDAEVRIIANAQGVAAALALREPGTDPLLVLCESTLTAKRLRRPQHLATTPSAVVTIAELQAQGWRYIRA